MNTDLICTESTRRLIVRVSGWLLLALRASAIKVGIGELRTPSAYDTTPPRARLPRLRGGANTARAHPRAEPLGVSGRAARLAYEWTSSSTFSRA